MAHTLAVLLLISGLASVLATIPQLIKLLRVKHSNEFSLVSWTIWLLYQLVAAAYTFEIKSYVYLFINALWVCFYSAMIYLIIYYRRPKLQ